MKTRRTLIPVFIPHLGCPCSCAFCNQRSIAAPHAPTPQEVAAQIEESLGRIGAISGGGAELAFYGGSFTALDGNLQQAYLGAAAPFLRDGRISSIRLSTRPDAINEQILGMLRDYGVRTIELGAQSMQDAVLTAVRRGHTAAATREAARRIKANGFSLILQMMAGLPGEQPGDPLRSAEELAALLPDGVRIYPTVVVKNTELEQWWNQGLYVPLSLEEAVDLCADLIRFFTGRGIPVIRTGLQPTEELRGEVAAGPYHPAFGELCRARLMLREARERLTELCVPPASDVSLEVGRGKTSAMTGQHRANLEALRCEFGLKSLRVVEAEPALRGTENGGNGKIKVAIRAIY